MSVAYAIWAGAGAVGGVMIGVLLHKEDRCSLKLFLITVIITYTAGLKLPSRGLFVQTYVSGIRTDVGEAHFSAAFCANFSYDYFKLIQVGTPADNKFTTKFSPKAKIFKGGIFLQTPASPHLEEIKEELDCKSLDIILPKSRNLLTKLAGGLFSSMDENCTMIDFANIFKHPTILVAKYYLGSANHILLSVETLK